MCCSPNREAVWAATPYYTQAWQMLIKGKECYIVIVIYFPFRHKHYWPDINVNEATCCYVLMGMKPAASDWKRSAALRHVKFR